MVAGCIAMQRKGPANLECWSLLQLSEAEADGDGYRDRQVACGR
jgi:hypothetical protein